MPAAERLAHWRGVRLLTSLAAVSAAVRAYSAVPHRSRDQRTECLPAARSSGQALVECIAQSFVAVQPSVRQTDRRRCYDSRS